MTIDVVTGVVVSAEARVATVLKAVPDVHLVRRCADLPDLVAVVAAGRAQVAIVSADLPGLDRSTLQSLRAAGVGIVGLFDGGDEAQQRALLQWEVTCRLPVDAAEADLLVALQREATDPADRQEPGGPEQTDTEITGRAVGPSTPETPEGLDEQETQDDEGAVLTFWGPVGAPGTTTLALGVAVELARLGASALLIDADTHGAAIAQHLALLDEAPGLAAATRLAEAGRLDVAGLAGVAPEVFDGLRVLTGLPRADRWPEISAPAFEEVLRHARRLAKFTVLDVAAPLDDDEELSYDTMAPRRNAATVTALRAASTVVAVGSADPVGLQRLVRGLDDLRGVIETEPRVVITKVRTDAVGSNPEQRVSQALQRFAGIDDPIVIPDDRRALDRALLAGRLLADDAPASPARQAMAALAATLGDLPSRPRSSRRGGRRRLRIGG